ncbi:MAG TPA: HAD family hydrolase [Terriglobales bacterium]|nr:HAD family hydrolase [Terriglobales bacterium]
MKLCVFDLDHTLVNSPLDLAAMALEIRAMFEQACGPLPVREDRYRVGELIDRCRATSAELEAAAWTIALDHERRAVDQAWLEPGALDALLGARAAGCGVALWTNNAREVTALALERFGLPPHFDLVVTRDEMAAMKPAPDGWSVIARHFGAREQDAVVIGDSWVDGLAAAKAGVPFIAYRAKTADLERWGVTPVAHLTDLAALPAWLAAR